ncbi:MAG: putative glycoside hydrolase [Ignavibacteriales bacterium]
MKKIRLTYIFLIIFILAIFAGIGLYSYSSYSILNKISKQNGSIKQEDKNNSQPPTQELPKAESQKASTLPDYKVKGIYVTGWSAGNQAKINHFINLLSRTELNTLVIDVKDDLGRVSYKSDVPLAKESGATKTAMIGDIKALMKKLKSRNIHTIARIVVFKDPILAEKKPELALLTASGTVWHDRNNTAWLDPFNEKSWSYSIDLAKEAVKNGFDEVQFDYVRFPADGKVKTLSYNKPGSKPNLVKPINAFLSKSKSELNQLGVPVSADIFGIVTTNIGDIEKIGQDLEPISKTVDFISPMVYPSHYALGEYKIRKPDLEPYRVVYKSLYTANERLSKIKDTHAKIRPYLQDFSASWLGRGNFKKYTAEDVKAQIKAVYDSGLEEWILWNAGNKYNESAFQNINQTQ